MLPGFVLIGLGVLLCIVGAIISTIENRKRHTYTSSSANSSVGDTSVITYTIHQTEFEGIVYKCAYRIRRVENVIVEGCIVSLTIKSQSNLSTWDTQLIFNLSDTAEAIGDYTVISEHDDSQIPEYIGRSIKTAILESVGIL